jgi:serine/threonine protein kinase
LYRDLKPDNVVVDSEGHVLLTDFGLSKEGVHRGNHGANSFCGSYAYLSPEVIRKQGHGKAVDCYLLGVIFYEMLFALPPFIDNNKQKLFQNILHE